MSLRLVLWVYVMGLSFGLIAQDKKEEPCETDGPVGSHASMMMKVAYSANKKCPDPSKLENICNSVSDISKDKDKNSSYTYAYQRKIYEAACVDYENDEEIVISKKVNTLWKQNADLLKCNSPHFNVPNGSIIKFAVAKRFKSFIEEVSQVWKLDLNVVDPADKRTVLDYVQEEIERNKGTANEQILREYYRVLKQAGAKHHFYKSQDV